jgi:hypothetical protein
MIISILTKAFFFYFLYKVIKGALGAYIVYKRVKAQAHTRSTASGGGFSGNPEEAGAKPKKENEKGTVEAEYRVVSED